MTRYLAAPNKYTVEEASLTGAGSYVYDAVTSVSTVAKNIATTTAFTATKKWVNGPVPAVDFRLMRSYTNAAGTVITERAKDQNGTEYPLARLSGPADETTWQYSWANLPRFNDSANFKGAYTYYVEEITPANYTAAPNHPLTPDTITNNYAIPLKPISATKLWAGGPKPEVYLKLYRQLGTGTPAEVPEAGIMQVPANGPDRYTVTWPQIQQTNLQGNPYTFTVREVNSQGEPYTPPYYSKVESGLQVTNSYTIPKGSVEASKVWEGGPDSRPTVWFKLYRNIQGGAVEEVPTGQAPLKELVSGETEVSWANIELTDGAGLPYTFTVKEVNSAGTEYTPPNYVKFENGRIVTNSYVASASLTLGGAKTLTGRRPLAGDSFTFEVYKSDAVGNIPLGAVPLRSKTITPTGNVTNYTFDLPLSFRYDLYGAGGPYNDIGDHYYLVKEKVPAADPIQGITYSTLAYPVKVTVGFGTTPNGQLALTASYGGAAQPIVGQTLSGLDFINAYAISVPVKKTWDDQDNAFGLRRSVTVELLQNNASFIPAETAVLNELNGWQHTFPGLPLETAAGVPYVYTVKEITAVPGYTTTYSADKLTIINTLDTVDIPVEKRWQGGDYELAYRPSSVTVELLQNQQPFVPAKTVVLNAENFWKHTFLKLPKTDASGNAYAYHTQEVSQPVGYMTTYSPDTLTVTNSFRFLQGVTATKSWVLPLGYTLPAGTQVELTLTGRDPLSAIHFQEVVTLDGVVDTVLGPNGGGERAPWIYTWWGLPELSKDGQTLTYSVTETKRPPSFAVAVTGNQTDGFTVTNTFQSTAVTFEKEYESGTVDGQLVPLPSPLPEVGFFLYQEDKLLYSHYLTGEGSHTWNNLPLYKDIAGTPYVYTVTEPVIPVGFVMQRSVDPETSVITFTNTYLGNVFSAKKQFLPQGTAPAPGTVTVWFQLYQQKTGGAATEYGDAVPLNGVVDPNISFMTDNGEYEPWSYIWHKLPSTVDGIAVKYYVKEVEPIPSNYAYDTVSTASTVATNYSRLTDFTATKNWVNGPKAPAVTFELWREYTDGTGTHRERALENGAELSIILTSADVSPANPDTWQKTVSGLPRYKTLDFPVGGPVVAIPYTYYVVEQPIPNYPNPVYSPAGTTPHTVTNRYAIPTGAFAIEKQWENGDHTRPDVWFKLYRSHDVPLSQGGTVTITEAVPEDEAGLPKLLSGGGSSVDWAGLNLTTIEGHKYTFSVVEGRLDGTTFTPGASPSYDVSYLPATQTSPYTVKNTYSAAGSVTIGAFKHLTGRPLAAGAFSFQMIPWHIGSEPDAPARNSSGQPYEISELAVSNAAPAVPGGAGAVTFPTLYFNESDIGKEYLYILWEEPGTEKGMQYAPYDIQAFVRVTDAGGGKLNLDVTFQGPGGNEAVFRNGYTAAGTWSPVFYKQLFGRPLEEGEFSFLLKQGETTVGTADNGPPTGPDGLASIAFPPIAYTQDDIGKLYAYTVTEQRGTAPGVHYDGKTVTALVQVVDKGNGELAVELLNPTSQLDMIFYNEFHAAGSWQPVVYKRLNGRPLKANEFSFTLTGSGQNQTKTNAMYGGVLFDAIQYTQDDVGKQYSYLIKETRGSEEGMAYAELEITATVTVAYTEADGLTVTASYRDAAGNPLTQEQLVFENTYTASGTWLPQVTKALTGLPLEADAFSFTLNRDGALVDTAANTLSGQVTFQPVTFRESDIGKAYFYTIKETPGTMHGMVYDGKEISVLLVIEDAGNGSLTVTPTYFGETQFNNAYEPELADITAWKEWVEGPEADHTGVELSLWRSVDGASAGQVEGVTPIITPAEGTASHFTYVWKSQPVYNSTGKAYTYYVKEAAESGGQVTINGNRYTVTMENATITNTYQADDPDPISVPVQVMKRTEGFALKAGDFSFTLYDRPGDAVETVKNREKGEVVFDPIRIPRAGTYVFTIKEVLGSRPSVHYDPGVIQVRITAKELGGVLSATVSYAKDGVPTANPAFVNSLEMPATGDQNLRLPLILLALSALAGAGWLITRRRHRKA